MTTAFIFSVASFAFGFFGMMGVVFGKIAAKRWLKLLGKETE